MLGWCASLVGAELYKWTDENGVTHYSDKAPEGREAEQRALPKAPDSPPPAEAAAATPESARCQTLRRNLEIYENNTSIEADLDGDGVPEPMDAERHQQELQRTREQIARLCPPA
jgi:hypothetical protein